MPKKPLFKKEISRMPIIRRPGDEPVTEVRPGVTVGPPPQQEPPKHKHAHAEAAAAALPDSKDGCQAEMDRLHTLITDLEAQIKQAKLDIDALIMQMRRLP